MKGALIVLGFLATSFLIPLLQDEVKEVLPWLAERLVRRAARRMPEEVRDDYANEWVAELYGKPGRIAKLWFAAKIARGAGKTGRRNWDSRRPGSGVSAAPWEHSFVSASRLDTTGACSCPPGSMI